MTETPKDKKDNAGSQFEQDVDDLFQGNNNEEKKEEQPEEKDRGKDEGG